MAPLLRGVIDSGEPLLDHESVSETPALPGKPRTWIGHFYPLKDATGQVIEQDREGVVEVDVGDLADVVPRHVAQHHGGTVGCRDLEAVPL